jgi:hypothetical protein
MPRERGFNDRRLSHEERDGQGGQDPLRHGGVLHQGEDPTVKRSGLVCMVVMVRWPRQRREMVDQMGTGRRDQPAEPQYGPERRELPAVPMNPGQERARLLSGVCSRPAHGRGCGRPHRVHQRGRTSRSLGSCWRASNGYRSHATADTNTRRPSHTNPFPATLPWVTASFSLGQTGCQGERHDGSKN